MLKPESWWSEKCHRVTDGSDFPPWGESVSEEERCEGQKLHCRAHLISILAGRREKRRGREREGERKRERSCMCSFSPQLREESAREVIFQERPELHPITERTGRRATAHADQEGGMKDVAAAPAVVRNPAFFFPHANMPLLVHTLAVSVLVLHISARCSSIMSVLWVRITRLSCAPIPPSLLHPVANQPRNTPQEMDPVMNTWTPLPYLLSLSSHPPHPKMSPLFPW